jgi:hypothetical protein
MSTAEHIWGVITSDCTRLGYGWTPQRLGRPYDCFVFGVRLAASRDMWDDALGVCYLDDSGRRCVIIAKATTDPGVIASPRADGMAILLPGQYRGSHRLGWHRGDLHRPALIQHGPLMIGRDRRIGREGEWIPGPPMAGGGINIHSPHRDRLSDVGAASEGCQVAHTRAGMEALLAPVRQQAARGMGAVVSYTLFSSQGGNGWGEVDHIIRTMPSSGPGYLAI